MTSEVVVGNKHGIALATDSAVTISSENGNKVIGPTKKLFCLPDCHKVGVMFYGNANFMDVPWEIIINEYENQLPEEPFDKLRAYRKDFIDFLKDADNLFPEEKQIRFTRMYIESVFRGIRDDLRNRVEERMNAGEELTREQINEIAENTIAFHKNYWKNGVRSSSFPEGFERAFVKDSEDLVLEIIGEVFENFPIEDGEKSDLINIASFSITRFPGDFVSNILSGVVFAGFGEEDIFGSVSAVELEGLFENYPKYKRNADMEIGSDNASIVVPFAQRNMVNRFMEGVDPKYIKFEKDYMEGLLGKFSDFIVDKLGDKCDDEEKDSFEEEMDGLTSDLLQEYLGKLHDVRKKLFVNPITRVVMSLPKEELGFLARALVDITSLKKSVSFETETVGEPIDVAVISKSDGFIWVNRNRYYDRDLNLE